MVPSYGTDLLGGSMSIRHLVKICLTSRSTLPHWLPELAGLVLLLLLPAIGKRHLGYMKSLAVCVQQHTYKKLGEKWSGRMKR